MDTEDTKSFAEHLKETVERYGERAVISKNKIAEQAGIDSSYFNRIINGKQFLSDVSVLDRLLDILNCSGEERRYILKAWHIEQMSRSMGFAGTAGFVSCMDAIRSLFCRPLFSGRLNLECEEVPQIPMQGVVEGNGSITAWLHNLLLRVKSGGGSVRFFQGGSDRCRIMEEIEGLWVNSGLRCRHLIELSAEKNAYESLNNLERLQKAILCLIDEFDYEVRVFFHGNEGGELSDGSSFSAVITDEAVLWLLGGEEKAIILRDEEQIELFQSRFDKAFDSAKRMAVQCRDSESLQQEIHRIRESGACCHMISYQLGILQYMSGEMIQKHFRGNVEALTGNTGQIRQQAENGKDWMKLVKKNKGKQFMPYEGLCRFLHTGKLAGVCGGAYFPFQAEERVVILKQLIREIKKNPEEFELLSEREFLMEEGITVVCADEKAAYANRIMIGGRNCCWEMKETGISRWLFSFLEYLPRSGWTYPKEKQLELLQRELKDLAKA